MAVRSGISGAKELERVLKKLPETKRRQILNLNPEDATILAKDLDKFIEDLDEFIDEIGDQLTRKSTRRRL